eukprot:4490459-Amphidinium_carterae.1
MLKRETWHAERDEHRAMVIRSLTELTHQQHWASVVFLDVRRLPDSRHRNHLGLHLESLHELCSNPAFDPLFQRGIKAVSDAHVSGKKVHEVSICHDGSEQSVGMYYLLQVWYHATNGRWLNWNTSAAHSGRGVIDCFVNYLVALLLVLLLVHIVKCWSLGCCVCDKPLFPGGVAHVRCDGIRLCVVGIRDRCIGPRMHVAEIMADVARGGQIALDICVCSNKASGGGMMPLRLLFAQG